MTKPTPCERCDAPAVRPPPAEFSDRYLIVCDHCHGVLQRLACKQGDL